MHSSPRKFLSSRSVRLSLVACLAAAVLIAATLASTAGGTPKAPSSPLKGKTFHFVVYTLAIPYFQEMVAGLKKQAKAMGINLKVSAANFDAAQEASLMESAITQRPDAIILAPIDRQALVPQALKAKAAGIPVVLVGDNFGATDQNAMLTFVGLETKQYGVTKSKFIAKGIGGKGKVVVIHGPRGLDYVEAQKVGYNDVFINYPGIKVIEGPYGNFSSEVGLKSLENVLTRTSHPSAVYFDNDDLAIGGLRALKERNISPSSVVTVASDGGPAAIAAVRRGELTMTVATRPYATGISAIKTLANYLRTHKAPPKLVKVPPVVLTKESLKKLKPAAYR
jgi:ABC-type sugar transport system substrate-binding protein